MIRCLSESLIRTPTKTPEVFADLLFQLADHLLQVPRFVVDLLDLGQRAREVAAVS